MISGGIRITLFTESWWSVSDSYLTTLSIGIHSSVHWTTHFIEPCSSLGILRKRESFARRHLMVQSQQWKHQSNVRNLLNICNKEPEQHHWRRFGIFIDAVWESLLLNLNEFHKLFWCFHCWLSTSTCQLSYIIQLYIFHVLLFLRGSKGKLKYWYFTAKQKRKDVNQIEKETKITTQEIFRFINKRTPLVKVTLFQLY